MTTGMRVLIVGYGEMGHAMECLLAGRHELQFWDIRPLHEHACVELEHAASVVDYVIFCVPVSPLAELLQRVLPTLGASTVSLGISKGLDDEGRPASRIFSDVYQGKRDYGVIYGPMIAEEICAGRPAFGQVGVSRPEIYAPVAGLFAGSPLLLSYSADMTGISWASVLKNIFAMLFGAAEELELGDNVRGFLAVACLREMEAIITRLGGQPETARQLAGLGDMVTTATSPDSRHHALGRRLARGEAGDVNSEGMHTLAMVRRYSPFTAEDFPLFSLVQAVVDNPADARRMIGTLIESS